jgi:phosphohistidine phosphatase
MGNLVRKARLTPELIIASPAARTRRTAEIVAERCGYAGSITWQRSLYGTETESHLTEIQGIGRGVSTALIVGHNPALEQVVAALTGGLIRLPAGALVLLEAGTEIHPLRRWADLSPGGCTLRWLVVPRLLRSLR